MSSRSRSGTWASRSRRWFRPPSTSPRTWLRRSSTEMRAGREPRRISPSVDPEGRASPRRPGRRAWQSPSRRSTRTWRSARRSSTRSVISWPWRKSPGGWSRSDPLRVETDFPVLHTDDQRFDDEEVINGSGFGMDLGVQWRRGPLAIGVAGLNVFNSFEWDQETLVFLPGTALLEEGSSETDFDPQPGSAAPAGVRALVTEMKFRPTVAVGVAYDVGQDLTVSADVKNRFGWPERGPQAPCRGRGGIPRAPDPAPQGRSRRRDARIPVRRGALARARIPRGRSDRPGGSVVRRALTGALQLEALPCGVLQRHAAWYAYESDARYA